MANLIETAMHVLSYFCIFVIYGLYVMQDRLRPGQNPNGDWTTGVVMNHGRGIQEDFGEPGSIIDIITISLIVGFFNGLSNFVVFIGGGEEALTGKSKLRAAILSATLFFFSTVYAFNAIRAQNRFANDYKPTKRHTKESNARANTVAASAAAFLLIELVITTILAVLAAGVNVPIVGSSDAAAKKEDREADGAPPKAEEQA